MTSFQQRDLLWSIPLSLTVGAGLASIQPGNWFIGWLGFSFLFFLSLFLLSSSVRWARGGKALAWMVVLAFVLRFAGGVATYLLLPVLGYDDSDDQQAGYVFTDAHRRDDQAWGLAASDRPIFDAFNRRFAYDQYGGLLAFSALVYRYVSPDAHRLLMLVLLSALMGALGLPFLWRAAHVHWGEKVARASGWIFALYPESILLGGSAMREPYLLALSAFSFWGFTDWQVNQNKKGILWIGLAIAGMLLVSPSIALVTLVILGGWMYFYSERHRISWWMIVLAVLVFLAGLLLLSSSMDRQGHLGRTPFAVINNFVRESLKWNVYQIEKESGWVQKLFDTMPSWMRLPFVMVYGTLQPVLPAILVVPTTVIWKVIGILRAVGWYILLPALIVAPVAASGSGHEAKRKLWMWLSLVAWGWILFTAMRGGGDQWDNPRYRTILFLWQAVLAGYVWVWWRETRNAWFTRVVFMEVVFVIVFGQWYVNRYLQIGVQLPFAVMVGLILGAWMLVLAWGVWRDRFRGFRHSV